MACWTRVSRLRARCRRGRDRAVFHFLTDPADRARYVALVRHAVRRGGHVIVASFAPEGPERCSGPDVVRYSPDAMHAEFGAGFQMIDNVREDRHTPSGSTQAFVYCLCRVGPAGSKSGSQETRNGA